MELDRIGKYQILGEIGRGTMGRVFKALDPVLNRYVAIKTLSASLGPADESRERFQREAQAAALLSHPNIVTVHDFGEEQGLIYMAMELLEGTDLRDAIGTGMLATLDDQLRIMEQVSAGLGFAHSKNVIHRDLKPANIHIQPNGQVKIVDFGLARLGGSEMTQDGVVLGTPNYMSPEQALGDKVDARSDIFSAGAVFYEILTGRKPFDAESTPGVLYQVVHKQPARIREYAPDVPMILVEVIERALAKDKNQRFQTARQMRAALGVVHQALESGRGGDATLANESQRLARAANRAEPMRKPAPLAGSASRPAWVDGTVALDLGANRLPGSGRTGGLETLSGKAPTQVDRRPLPGARAARASRRGPAYAGAGLLLAALAAGGTYYWMQSAPPPAAPFPAADPAKEQVGALTQALVETQVQLAVRDLQDKNYAGAITQAERALKIAPRNPDAKKVLADARLRRDELTKAAKEATAAFAAGDNEAASQALAHVLELDPRHPVGSELTEQLNSRFRSRAEEAGRSMSRSRADAEQAKALAAPGFAQAATLAGQAEALLKKGEFAEATRRYLEARDGFDRARRAAQQEQMANAVAPSTAPPADVPGAASGPSAAPSSAPVPDGAPAPSPDALSTRRFVTGKTVIATGKASGDLEGFDTADVKKQKMPDLAGRLEFEVSPEGVKAGDALTVKVYLVNQGKKTVRVKGLVFTAIVDGKRATVGGKEMGREVAPLGRVLVAEVPVVWPEDVRSWNLEVVVTSDRDETCTSRLSWM